MTTGTCLYDIEEYGIIAEIMGCSKQQEKASGIQITSTQPSLSSITSMSMVDHVLSRLRQNHDRNKARIIYYDLLNKICVPSNKIDYAINKCSQYRSDFNLSKLKKLMIVECDIKDGKDKKSTDEMKRFSNKLSEAIEITCQGQLRFKYIPDLDVYFYIPPMYKHRFSDELDTNTTTQEVEEEDDVREQIHSSSANDADDNTSPDEHSEVSDSSDDGKSNDDIPQSEAETLKTVHSSSAQEKRMHRRAKLRVRKPNNMTSNNNSNIGRKTPNLFNSILLNINKQYNIRSSLSENILIDINQTVSAPPPEAFASPFTHSPNPSNSSTHIKRIISSPIATNLFDEINKCSNKISSTLPYPLFVRFNVIIHGTANRFRSVSINDINE
eukprot:420902_1